jgi:hypothetical protein
MTTAKTFERLLTKSPELASATGASEQLVRKILKMAEKDIINRRRQPAPPPPKGGISIRAAGRKYNVDFRLVSTWVKRGLISVLLETPNNKFVEEKKVAELAAKYNTNPGRGKRTIFKQS